MSVSALKLSRKEYNRGSDLVKQIYMYTTAVKHMIVLLTSLDKNDWKIVYNGRKNVTTWAMIQVTPLSLQPRLL